MCVAVEAVVETLSSPWEWWIGPDIVQPGGEHHAPSDVVDLVSTQAEPVVGPSTRTDEVRANI